VKFIHLADTHLGKRRYGRVDHETGMNIFEKQLYENFLATCKLIATKYKPDFIIHAGDLFDSPRPPINAISTAIDALGVFEDSNIPCYVISGNHDQNKTIGKGHPFEILKRTLSDTEFIYKKPETFKQNDYSLHCIPYTLDASGDVVNISEKSGILVMHGIEELPSYYMSEFEYIALGHDHKMHSLYVNERYSGSTEYLTYGELQPIDFHNKHTKKKSWEEIETVQKGIIEVKDGVANPICDLPKMKMYQGGTLNCIDKSIGEITEYICSIADNTTIGAQCRVTLLNMANDMKSALDYRLIKEQSKHLLDLTIDVKYLDQDKVDLNLSELDKLDIFAEFQKFAINVSPQVFEFGKQLLEGAKQVE